MQGKMIENVVNIAPQTPSTTGGVQAHGSTDGASQPSKYRASTIVWASSWESHGTFHRISHGRVHPMECLVG